MTRAALLAALLVALAVLPAAAGIAAGQSGNATSTTPTTVAPATGDSERIDNVTTLVGSSYDAGTGMARITLRSEVAQMVTITDAGAFMTGGVVGQRTVVLSGGETTTVEMPVTETAEGWAGVGIATRNVLYAEPLTDGGDDLGNLGPEYESDLMALAIGGVLGPLAVLVGYRWRERKRKEGITHVG